MAKVPVCCPSCQTQFQVEDTLLGKKARCKLCQTHFVLARMQEDATVSSPWPWLSQTANGATAPDPGKPPAGEGAPGQWKPGDVILDLYEVREVFTSGGMGLVYRVWHRGWNLDLAVKCPRPEFFRHEQDKENFEREAETWVKLGLHPHTVACYYVRRLGGIPHVFAEYVAGGSLAEWIRTGRLYAGGPRKALGRILDTAIQFAWGLHHAHEQGLVHRDVKPGNVLLTTAGLAKVTDFGMARARGVTGEGTEGGVEDSQLVTAGGLTPAFCSPEQVRGQLVSRKTDVWSWAVSVLEMFTGGVTWSAGYLAPAALQDYLARGTNDPALPPMPPRLAELLQRCFRAEPDDRPDDMVEVATVLQVAYEEVTGADHGRETPLLTQALADSLNNRAVSLLDLKKQDEAEQLWEGALAADPQHPECTYNLGLSQWRGGRVGGDTLLRKLQEVCASHPGHWLPLYLLAQVHLEQGNWAAAREALEGITGAGARLDEVRSALAVARAWLDTARSRVRTYEGHADWVSSVCLTRDGRHALSGSADRTLRLWEVSTGQVLRVLGGHTEWVTSACLSGDGRYALSGSADQTLRWWDLARGKCLGTLEAHDKWVLAVALSADGRSALSGGGDGFLKRWDVAAGTEQGRLPAHTGAVTSVFLTADGRQALSGGRDGVVKLWDVAAGQCLRTFHGHGDRVLSVGLSADGALAVSGSSDRSVRLWDVTTGECRRSWEGHAGAVHAVCLTPDGRTVLSGCGDGTIKVWRASGERCLATLEGHGGAVNALCLGAGGRHVLSGSGDRTLALWALPRDVRAVYFLSRVLPSETALTAWADYEQALARAAEAATAGDAVGAAQLLRAARARPGYGRRPEALSQWSGLYVRLARRAFNGGWEGHTLEGHLDAVTAVCVSGDGRHALSGSADRTLRWWEAGTGHCLRTLEGQGSVVTAVCLGGDGRHALAGSADGTVKLWDTAHGRCLATFEGHPEAVTSVTLSADGRFAWTGSVDGLLRLWDTARGRCLYTLAGHSDPIQAVAASPDGRLVLSGSAQFLIRHGNERLFTSGQLRLWDVARGRCLHTFGEQAEAVTAVCLSADGRFAVSGGGRSVFEPHTGKSSQSGTVSLWETATGRHLMTFAEHAEAVTSVSLSTDGRYVLSGSTDRTVKLWDAADGQCLRTFTGHTEAVTSVSLSPDGRYALSAGADRLLKVWVLDWELADNTPADWDGGARPYLETFLARHTPYAAPLPAEVKRGLQGLVGRPLARLRPSLAPGEALSRALTRQGKPVWSDEDFEALLYTVGCAGYGWLRPQGVRRQLERLARGWRGPPSPDKT
jgi:WD40 repeat protein/serine/threonine protein kinase